MKVLLIGASGTIGKAIASNLTGRHEVLSAGAHSGDYRADISDPAQVRALFERVGKIDAVVVAAGVVHFGPLAQMQAEQFQIGLNSKLMGQVNVAQIATAYLNDGGSITLTSGIIGAEPIRCGAAAAMVNSALEGFVRNAALELPRGLRMNVVSPTVLSESLPTYGPYFLGFEAAPGSRVALAYSRSVDGAHSGQVYRVW